MPCTLSIVGGNDHDCFTLREAAEVLDPPIEVWQLEHLVAAARLAPRGTRYQPRGGRPPRTYPIAEIQRLHTAFVPWLVTAFSG